MMSRLKDLFDKKQRKILNIYCTAGYPKLDSTIDVLHALQDNGADIIEIGMPYSDPLADGEVIQNSSAIALQNGMNISTLFEQLHTMQQSDKQVTTPLVLMGYLNPVMQYGFDKFCEDAASAGVSGLIIPDLPMYEFENEYGAIIKNYGLDFIFLVTPETSEERIRMIDGLCSGFLYAVSSSSTTGNTKNINDQVEYFKRLEDMELKNPVLVGFGIKDKETFTIACKHSNGAIIGSAYIKALENSTDIPRTTEKFLKSILQ